MKLLIVVSPLAAITVTLGVLGLGIGTATAQENPTYRNAELGINLQYPVSWIEGAAGEGWTCNDCAVLGPPNANPPAGVVIFDTTSPSPGCEISCFAGNDAVGFSAQATVRVGGRDAGQQEFERTPSLGPLGSTTLTYREVWTGVPGGKGLIVIAGFWPKDNVSLEADVRSAYQEILGSLQFEGSIVAGTPTRQVPPAVLPGSGLPETASHDGRLAIASIFGLLAVGLIVVGSAIRFVSGRRS
ncbi:MAG: hypothetical protein HYX50_02975 [Chloroflexi bacterium]|nr:hypothetical protein [Chloroflexota bacterium]